ncbi:MAG: hypothetical protein R3E68_21060 [Burkholderiaceae bacterium]
MNQDFESTRLSWGGGNGAGRPGLLTRIVAVLVGASLLVVGLMFSAVVLAIAAVVGVGIWAWLWWKTRGLRRDMKAQMDRLREAGLGAGAGGPSAPGTARHPPAEGVIIDGDFIQEARGPQRPDKS